MLYDNISMLTSVLEQERFDKLVDLYRNNNGLTYLHSAILLQVPSSPTPAVVLRCQSQ